MKFRSIAIREPWTLQFRVDALNFTNTPLLESRQQQLRECIVCSVRNGCLWQSELLKYRQPEWLWPNHFDKSGKQAYGRTVSQTWPQIDLLIFGAWVEPIDLLVEPLYPEITIIRFLTKALLHA